MDHRDDQRHLRSAADGEPRATASRRPATSVRAAVSALPSATNDGPPRNPPPDECPPPKLPRDRLPRWTAAGTAVPPPRLCAKHAEATMIDVRTTISLRIVFPLLSQIPARDATRLAYQSSPFLSGKNGAHRQSSTPIDRSGAAGYSFRSAATGSIHAALRAGPQQANRAVAVRARATAMKTDGSPALTS